MVKSPAGSPRCHTSGSVGLGTVVVGREPVGSVWLGHLNCGLQSCHLCCEYPWSFRSLVHFTCKCGAALLVRGTFLGSEVQT